MTLDDNNKNTKEILDIDLVMDDAFETDEYQEIDLDLLEPDEAIGELFEKINPLTIPAVIVGIIFLVISYTSLLNGRPIANIVVGFSGGLSFIFGCSELIIFGVKGLAQKFGWSDYFMGTIAAIGADSSDVVVVTILLIRAKQLTTEGNIDLANNLAVSSITLILTSVLINTLILGVTMLVVSRKKPLKLPPELTGTESNLVLAMAIFSFILIAFGFTHNSIGIEQFDRVFQGVMGVSLLLFYIIFIVFLIADAKQKSTEKIGPQLLISEYFPEDEDYLELKQNGESEDSQMVGRRRKFKDLFRKDDDEEEGEQFIALRRFPWYILVIAFGVGITGIIFGGTLIGDSIEFALFEYNLPILLYSVIVGFVSSAPEMTITFRAISKPDAEDLQIGLVHQISSVNQTFFLLFGFPFLFASIINVNIPVALDTTLVFTGIFAISLGLHLTIIDDNHFDRVEGALILITSITSLISLAVVGGLLS